MTVQGLKKRKKSKAIYIPQRGITTFGCRHTVQLFERRVPSIFSVWSLPRLYLYLDGLAEPELQLKQSNKLTAAHFSAHEGHWSPHLDL